MSNGEESVKKRGPVMALGLILAAWIVLNVVISPSANPAVVCGRDLVPDAGTVVMLSASWCRYCRRARAYMQEQGIVHCEYDVETTAEGRRQFAEMPVKMIPVLKIGEDTLVGFSEDELEHALVASGIADLDEYGD
jgi:glutaredoxin